MERYITEDQFVTILTWLVSGFIAVLLIIGGLLVKFRLDQTKMKTQVDRVIDDQRSMAENIVDISQQRHQDTLLMRDMMADMRITMAKLSTSFDNFTDSFTESLRNLRDVNRRDT